MNDSMFDNVTSISCNSIFALDDEDYNFQLPNQIFFKPNQEFIGWVVDFSKDRSLIEIGCGLGHLSKEIKKTGKQILSIDSKKREGQYREVVILDATRFPYPPNCIVILARPNSGRWIVESITRSLEDAFCFLYIGFSKNIVRDLGGLDCEKYRIEQIKENVGQSNENVWMIQRIDEYNRKDHKMKFELINMLHLNYTTWFRVDHFNSRKIYNYDGGYMEKPKDKSLYQVLETIEGDSWDELDFKKTSYYKPELKCGWLSPLGEWHGCEPEDHDNYAELVLKSLPDVLLKKGWVRIKESTKNVYVVYTEKKYTDAQINFLESKHYNYNEDDYLNIEEKLNRISKYEYPKKISGD